MQWLLSLSGTWFTYPSLRPVPDPTQPTDCCDGAGLALLTRARQARVATDLSISAEGGRLVSRTRHNEGDRLVSWMGARAPRALREEDASTQTHLCPDVSTAVRSFCVWRGEYGPQTPQAANGRVERTERSSQCEENMETEQVEASGATSGDERGMRPGKASLASLCARPAAMHRGRRRVPASG